MNSSLFLLIIAVVACVAWWHARRSTTRNLPGDQSPRSELGSPFRDDASAATESRDHGAIGPSVDPFLAAVAAEKQRMTEAVDTALNDHEHELDARFSDDVQVKDRLSRFAKENELDRALIAVWEEMKCYPAWSQRDDFAKWNKLELVDISGSDDNDVRTVNFSTNDGQRFTLIEKSWTAMDGDPFADFSLLEDGVEVFAIGCSVDFEEYGSRYNCYTISGFKKRGNWAATLLGLYGRTQIERQKLLANTKYFRADEIKSRFEE